MADKAIFSQPEDNNPALTNRLAHGNDTTASNTMSFSGLISWLESKLGFFKVSNNLSEGNAATIRNNINTYSKDEIDTKDALKADKSNVLELDNTDDYTPTLPTHPANKGYVDQSGALKTYTFYSKGDNVVEYSAKVRQRGNIVNITGYFRTDGADGSDETPLLIVSTVLVATFTPPADDVYFTGVANWAGSTDPSCKLKLRNFSGIVSILLTSSSSNNATYNFNVTYIV